MKESIREYLSQYPDGITDLYEKLLQLIYESAAEEPTETLWAKLPSYSCGEAFVRLIPFRDHINVEARAVLSHREELAGYKITPRGMLQIFLKQAIPCEVLKNIFAETLLR